MTPDQRRARGYAAKALLEDATLQDGWQTIEREMIEEWAKPAPYHDERAKAAREGIWIELQVLRRLRQKLASYAAQGKE